MLRAPLRLLLAGLLLPTACGDEATAPLPADATDSGDGADSTTTDGGTDDDAAVGEPEPTFTYWRDAKAILDAKCGSCHQPDDIAPFPLQTYADVAAVAAILPSSLMAESMPPWPPGDDCRPYAHDRSLDDDALDVLLTWLDEGAPEGDPADAPPPSGEPPAAPWSPSAVVEMPEPYTPVAEPDDYRCFLVPWGETDPTYITGYQVVPGNRSVVHHVIVFNAEAEIVPELEAMDAAEPGPGYTCFGGAGVPANWVGSWVPGSDVSRLPEDTGIRIEPGSMMIVQMHYNTLSSGSAEDQTRVEFETRDQVARPGLTVPFTKLQWVTGTEPMHIPAGDPVVTHSYDLPALLLKQRLDNLGLGVGDSFLVHNVGLHMHYLGTAGRLSVVRDDDQEDCMLDIDRWDFGWQGGYTLRDPMRIDGGDRLRISCTWDNSADNQPVVDGDILPPQDVEWGEGTTDEMCLGVMYVTAE